MKNGLKFYQEVTKSYEDLGDTIDHLATDLKKINKLLYPDKTIKEFEDSPLGTIVGMEYNLRAAYMYLERLRHLILHDDTVDDAINIAFPMLVFPKDYKKIEEYDKLVNTKSTLKSETEKFIKYCKDNGVNVKIEPSDDPDTFEKIFGISFIDDKNKEDIK